MSGAAPEPAGRPAVFLDRDGTLVEDRDYLVDPDELALIPGAADAMRRLAQAGYLLVVVTNQSAVARGMLDEPGLARVHERLAAMLAAEGARWDAVYHCPHHPSEGVGGWKRACDCRKPLPGMLLRAAEELGIDLARSWTVGDSVRDLAAGLAAGTRAILVRTGKGRDQEARARAGATSACPVVDDLTQAAALVLARP